MDPVRNKLNAFATRLLVYEAGVLSSASAAEASPVFLVCEKLRLVLCQLMGVGGFRSLLSRALALAGAEVPWLRAVHLKSDGSLEGLEVLQAKLAKQDISLGEVTLVARLLGLLVTFIGPALTLGVVQEGWPKASFGDSSFGKGT